RQDCGKPPLKAFLCHLALLAQCKPAVASLWLAAWAVYRGRHVRNGSWPFSNSGRAVKLSVNILAGCSRFAVFSIARPRAISPTPASRQGRWLPLVGGDSLCRLISGLL